MIGGAGTAQAAQTLVVNSNNVLLDDLWLWRADHGTGVGWAVNPATNGLIVNGSNVTAYGLFVEHYQQYQVIWNGNGGRDDLLQKANALHSTKQAGRMEASNDTYA